MSTTDVTLTPPSFDAYLEQEHADPAGQQRCDCCGEHRDCWTSNAAPNPDTTCDECLRQHHAFYLDEEQKVRTLLGTLDAPALQTILDLFDMWVDTRLPDLVYAISTELLDKQTAD